MILLVFLVLYERYRKNRYVVAAVLASVAVLLIYSMSFKVTLTHSTSLINDIITRDLDMNWNLWYIIERANILSSDIISSPGSGYLYNALIFAPRRILPFKGYSTTLQFTYYYGTENNIPLGASNISEMNWQYKFGMIQESLMNFGYFGLICFSVLLGLILRRMESTYSKYRLTYGVLAYISMTFSYSPLFTITTLLLPAVLAQVVLEKGLTSKRARAVSTHGG